MYKHVPGFLTSLNIKPEDNTPWETLYDEDRGLARVPRVVNVSANFTYVGDTMPSTTSPNHYNIADWINPNDPYWGGEYGEAMPVDMIHGPNNLGERNEDIRRMPPLQLPPDPENKPDDKTKELPGVPYNPSTSRA